MTVLYADDFMAAVDKPSGLLSVPGRRDADCVVNRLTREYGWIREVHRLDQATSGVMLLARNPDVHRNLSRLFAEHRVEKIYLAVTATVPRRTDTPGLVFEEPREGGFGRILLRQRLDPKRRPMQIPDPDHGRCAETLWRPGDTFGSGGKRWFLDLKPLTGRTHQLRLALAICGAPILGDSLYGDTLTEAASPRLLLHACTVELSHPVSGRRLSIAAPLPEEFLSETGAGTKA